MDGNVLPFVPRKGDEANAHRLTTASMPHSATAGESTSVSGIAIHDARLHTEWRSEKTMRCGACTCSSSKSWGRNACGGGGFFMPKCLSTF